MRIALPINWNLTASSLTNIARHTFREIGKMMNETKSFTIAATRLESLSVGDFNQHFDLAHIPNIGGYGFPLNATSHCKNIICGLVGIDEVIYGKEVMVGEGSWILSKPHIKKALENWEKYNEKIKFFHVGTESEREEMHQYLKIPYEKIKIIPLGVDHDFFKPSIDKDLTRKQVLSELKIPYEKYFFHVSEMNFARKNQIRLAEAYQMARESGLKHNLIIAGKYLPQIKKKIGHLPGIFFLDWVTHEQLLQLYQGADAFVLPSIHEGFGMPLVESMCCGVPCISTNKHSPPHLIQDAGILINPHDVSQISDSMLNIVKDPKLLKQLSEKSLKRSEYFSWKKYAKQVFELYDIDYTKKMADFDTQYELAAYRTLVTVCDTFPDTEHPLLFSLLKLDYTKLLEWAADYGLHDSKTKDFLIPFESWIYKKLGRSMDGDT
jgi:glycosyltransferase involved in cell wall biosynthesis